MAEKTQSDILFVATNSYDRRDIPEIKARGGAHALPPLGPLTVATFVEEKGFRVDLLDSERDLLTEEQTAQEIMRIMPDGGFVGFAGWIISVDRSAGIARRLKESGRDYRTILGGPHPSATPVRTMEKYGDVFDVAINGEGELATLEVLRTWGDKEHWRQIPGFIFKDDQGELTYLKDSVRGYTRPIQVEDGVIKVASQKAIPELSWPAKAERIEDINEIPIPRYEMLGEISHYHLSEFGPKKGEFQLSMLTSRGCPYACYFCDQEVSGHSWRGLTPSRIVESMQYLRRLGVTDFYLTDDLYLVRLDEVEETARLILETPELRGCIWEAITRANLADKAAARQVRYKSRAMNLLELLYEAGCRQLHIAPESGNEDLRAQAIGKKISNLEIEESVISLAQAGIRVKILNMVGIPGETPEKTLQTLQFIKRLGEGGASYAMISICTPLPNTPLAIQIENGKLGWTGDLDAWEKMNLGDPAGVFTTDIHNNPVDYTPEELLLIARGKHRLGNSVTEEDIARGDTIDQKIDRFIAAARTLGYDL